MPVDILLDSGGDILVNAAADITPQYVTPLGRGVD